MTVKTHITDGGRIRVAALGNYLLFFVDEKCVMLPNPAISTVWDKTIEIEVPENSTINEIERAIINFQPKTTKRTRLANDKLRGCKAHG